jgi:hypothetical protein
MQQRGEARERFQQLSASTTKAVETIKRSRPANGSSSLLPPADLPQPITPLADIRHDVLVHAESLAKEVTALTLALKPPVTVEAVVAELDKLGGIVAKLSYVVELLPAVGAMTKRLRYVCRFGYQPLRADLSELKLDYNSPDGTYSTSSKRSNNTFHTQPELSTASPLSPGTNFCGQQRHSGPWSTGPGTCHRRNSRRNGKAGGTRPRCSTTASRS